MRLDRPVQIEASRMAGPSRDPDPFSPAADPTPRWLEGDLLVGEWEWESDAWIPSGFLSESSPPSGGRPPGCPSGRRPDFRMDALRSASRARSARTCTAGLL